MALIVSMYLYQEQLSLTVAVPDFVWGPIPNLPIYSLAIASSALMPTASI